MAMTATALQDLRANYPSLLDRHELRPEKYSLLMKGVENANNPSTGIISADVLEKARISWGRDVDIPVMEVASQANGTGITCTFTGTEAVSAFVNLTFVTISNGFQMQPAKNFQNEIKYSQEFARKYSDAIRAMAGATNALIDTALDGALAAAADYTSSYIGAGKKYGAIPVSDAIQVSLANRPDFFNDLVDINAADDIFPQFDVLSSINGRGIISQLFAQGAANSTNTAYQFSAGDFNFAFDKDVTLGVVAATDASGYVMPVGAYGVMSRNSPDCLANNVTTDGKQYGIVSDPTMGMDLDTLYFSSCADINALSGNASDVSAVQETHQMAAHFCILTPFEATGSSGVIRKFDLLTA
jgi:hypothetical protein